MTPGLASLGFSGSMALMTFGVRLEGRGALKDTCWLMGPNGIKKEQGGSRVALEDDRNLCQGNNHSGQLVGSAGGLRPGGHALD